MPIYALAFLAILLFCFFSHRINQRGTGIAIAGGISIIGYLILILTGTAGARLVGAFFAVGGCYAGASCRTLPLALERILLTHDRLQPTVSTSNSSLCPGNREEAAARVLNVLLAVVHGPCADPSSSRRSSPPLVAERERLAADEARRHVGQPDLCAFAFS